MADFGTVAGSFSVVGLFVNCVQALRYFHLVRHFGHDFESYYIQIELVRLRLSRWGEAVRVHERDLFTASRTPQEVSVVWQILERVRESINTAIRKTKKYHKTEHPGHFDARVYGETDLSAVFQRLHSNLQQTTQGRQKTASFLKKGAWVLYDRHSLGHTIKNLGDLITALESLCPMETIQQECTATVINDANTERALVLYGEAVATGANGSRAQSPTNDSEEGTSNSATQNVEANNTSIINSVNNNNNNETKGTSEDGVVIVGDVASPEVAGGKLVSVSNSNSGNKFGAVKGRSVVMIGTRYGMPDMRDILRIRSKDP